MSEAKLANPAAAFLRTVSLFAELTETEARELAWATQPFECEAGQRLFRQGEPANEMYCLQRGRVQLTIRLSGEGEVALATLGPRDVLGEMALMDAEPRAATATAIEPLAAYTIPRRAFDVLRAAYRPSACKVLRRLATVVGVRLRVTTQALVSGYAPPASVLHTGGDHQAPSAGHGAEERIAALRCPTDGLARESLCDLPAFQEFSRAEIELLLESVYQLAVPRGQVVFREGDQSGSCFIVVRGAVQESVERDGRPMKLALYGLGQLFGELALLEAHARVATCLARENSIVLELQGRRFDELFAAESIVAFKLLGAANQRLVESLRSANRRLAWLAAQGRYGHR